MPKELMIPIETLKNMHKDLNIAIGTITEGMPKELMEPIETFKDLCLKMMITIIMTPIEIFQSKMRKKVMMTIDKIKYYFMRH